MKFTGFIISSLIMIMTFSLSAAPAKRGLHTLTQPDGSTFTATLHGDEFTKIRKTADGHAIMQEDDRWWYYAIYDSEGNSHNSGWKVGSGAPGNILSACSSIPYGVISQKAKIKRAEFAEMTDGTDFFSRLNSIPTKSGEVREKHGLVILAQFKDVKFKYTRDDFERLLKEEGYSVNGATGSAKDYFDSQFNGKVNFSFDVTEIVTVSENRAFYGANKADGSDKNPAEFIIEACQLADEAIDFSMYDDNKDGKVDNIFVFYAGQDEAERAPEECIWAHSWFILSGAGKRLTLDGCKIDRYACASEISGKQLTHIGTFCHEYCHTFDLPDMYDTDYETDGMAAGLWSTTSLMDGGNYNNEGRTPPCFNAIEREILGLAEGTLITDDGHFTLNPINESNSFLRLETDQEGEYYLFECRKNSGWDEYIGGNGMLVYHIDKKKDFLDKWNIENTVNAFASHQCVDLLEADSRTDHFTDFNAYSSAMGRNTGLFFPYNNVKSITPEGKPSLKYWSGQQCMVSVTGIARKGDAVEFSITGINGITNMPEIADLRYEAFYDGIIISFESNWAYDGKASLAWKMTSEDVPADTIEISPYSPGKYAVLIEGLSPGKTYSFSAFFRIGDIEGNSENKDIMTRKKPAVEWPFIHFGSGMEEDGTFKQNAKIPLKVYNAEEAQEITWMLDKKVISRDKDLYYKITTGGTLKAHIRWKDGSEEMLIKKIIISE